MSQRRLRLRVSAVSITRICRSCLTLVLGTVHSVSCWILPLYSLPCFPTILSVEF
jgi:hypothetical protein